VISTQNSLAVKIKGAALFKMASVKEVKGGSQEMAVMAKVDGKNFNNNSDEFCADS